MISRKPVVRALLTLILLAAPSQAATVLAKTVTVAITPPSNVVEHTRLRVRLEIHSEQEVAEHRAGRRRVRLVCGGDESPP